MLLRYNCYVLYLIHQHGAPPATKRERDMEFTAEELFTAIHEVSSLEELRRMVGPSEQEKQANVARMAKLDRYFEQYGTWGGDNWPDSAKALLTEQNKFESIYC